MAYLDFRNQDMTESVALAPRLSRPKALTPLERSAVMLARIDPVSSLDDPGLRYAVADFIFGPDKVNRLADPRLEALRSFGVAVAHGRDDLAAREEARLLSLGFDRALVGEARILALTWRRTDSWLERHLPSYGFWRASTLSLY